MRQFSLVALLDKYDINLSDRIPYQQLERPLEESILIITEEIHTRLSTLMSSEDLGSPPKLLRKRKGKTKPRSVLIGKAVREQQAIAVLYCDVCTAHNQTHKLAKMPFGVNPHVDFEHYRNHVMIPVLFEMLKWSVHRAFPEQKTNLAIRFDRDWNMYALPDRRKRKRKKK